MEVFCDFYKFEVEASVFVSDTALGDDTHTRYRLISCFAWNISSECCMIGYYLKVEAVMIVYMSDKHISHEQRVCIGGVRGCGVPKKKKTIWRKSRTKKERINKIKKIDQNYHNTIYIQMGQK